MTKVEKTKTILSKHGFLTTSERSRIMQRIHGTETRPEVELRRRLRSLRLSFDQHDRQLPGTPDFVFKRGKIVVFLDGDFWHGYNWSTRKKSITRNRKYWIKKIETNMRRDRRNRLRLQRSGWKVVRIWDHDLKKNPARCLGRICQALGIER